MIPSAMHFSVSLVFIVFHLKTCESSGSKEQSWQNGLRRVSLY
jgi:hypothetical protein